MTYWPYFFCKESKERIELRLEGSKDGTNIKYTVREICKAFNDDAAMPCSGLDVVFEPGYQQGCCDEYNLCC